MNKAIPLLIVFVTVFAFSATIQKTDAQTTVYTYTLNGPYYDDGGVANANVSVAVLWVNGSILRFTMMGDGATANTTSFDSNNKAFQIIWNASSALNYTRVIDLMENNETFNIYIPSPSLPAYVYTFLVTDFAGTTNAFLQTSLSINGTDSYVVERKNMNTTGSPTFVMAQYGTYTLSYICDQGVYSQLFTAANIFSDNLPILAGAFPVSNVTYPTFEAVRVNSTLIGMVYIDPSNDTDYLLLHITHRSNANLPLGILEVNDYYYGPIAGTPQTILWNEGDADKSYMVNATASIDGQIVNWMVPVPTEASTNPFEGIFDWLGQYTPTLPHYQTGWPKGMTTGQIGQLVAAFFIMLFLCIGSFRSAGACCILSWVIFGIMIYLGWYGIVTPTTIPMFAFSGFLGMLIMIDESKQTTREA